MKIIPAIDIMNGGCVRLMQGDFSKKISYGNPLEQAKLFEGAGLRRIHVVDLDGAKMGSVTNLTTLEILAKNTSLIIDFGGGIKSYKDACSVFNAGAQIISVGSMAIKNPELLGILLQEFGPEKIWIGADVKDEKIKISGWQQHTNLNIYDFIEDMITAGFNHFFCTDISKDGMLEGPATALYKAIKEAYPEIKLTASGGVSNLDDLNQLQQCGCDGAIVGKAYYEGNITLKQLAEF